MLGQLNSIYMYISLGEYVNDMWHMHRHTMEYYPGEIQPKVQILKIKCRIKNIKKVRKSMNFIKIPFGTLKINTST